MKQAKIKFSEEQVKLMITGKSVTVNLPDAQLVLTMDQTRIELRRGADKLKGLGVKPLGDFSDLFGEEKSSSFGDMFGDIFSGRKK